MHPSPRLRCTPFRDAPPLLQGGVPYGAISLAILLVILSNAKDLLAGNTLCALSLVGFEGILHFVQNDKARVNAKHGTKKVGSPFELPTEILVIN